MPRADKLLGESVEAGQSALTRQESNYMVTPHPSSLSHHEQPVGRPQPPQQERVRQGSQQEIREKYSKVYEKVRKIIDPKYYNTNKTIIEAAGYLKSIKENIEADDPLQSIKENIEADDPLQSIKEVIHPLMNQETLSRKHVAFVRHGESHANLVKHVLKKQYLWLGKVHPYKLYLEMMATGFEHPFLTEVGRYQAFFHGYEVIPKLIRKNGKDYYGDIKMYSSVLPRAMESAKIAAYGYNCWLKEHVDDLEVDKYPRITGLIQPIEGISEIPEIGGSKTGRIMKNSRSMKKDEFKSYVELINEMDKVDDGNVDISTNVLNDGRVTHVGGGKRTQKKKRKDKRTRIKKHTKRKDKRTRKGKGKRMSRNIVKGGGRKLKIAATAAAAAGLLAAPVGAGLGAAGVVAHGVAGGKGAVLGAKAGAVLAGKVGLTVVELAAGAALGLLGGTVPLALHCIVRVAIAANAEADDSYFMDKEKLWRFFCNMDTILSDTDKDEGNTLHIVYTHGKLMTAHLVNAGNVANKSPGEGKNPDNNDPRGLFYIPKGTAEIWSGISTDKELIKKEDNKEKLQEIEDIKSEWTETLRKNIKECWIKRIEQSMDEAVSGSEEHDNLVNLKNIATELWDKRDLGEMVNLDNPNLATILCKFRNIHEIKGLPERGSGRFSRAPSENNIAAKGLKKFPLYCWLNNDPEWYLPPRCGLEEDPPGRHSYLHIWSPKLTENRIEEICTRPQSSNRPPDQAADLKLDIKRKILHNLISNIIQEDECQELVRKWVDRSWKASGWRAGCGTLVIIGSGISVVAGALVPISVFAGITAMGNLGVLSTIASWIATCGLVKSLVIAAGWGFGGCIFAVSSVFGVMIAAGLAIPTIYLFLSKLWEWTKARPQLKEGKKRTYTMAKSGAKFGSTAGALASGAAGAAGSLLLAPISAPTLAVVVVGGAVAGAVVGAATGAAGGVMAGELSGNRQLAVPSTQEIKDFTKLAPRLVAPRLVAPKRGRRVGSNSATWGGSRNYKRRRLTKRRNKQNISTKKRRKNTRRRRR